MQLTLGKLPWYGQVAAFVAVSVVAVGAYVYFYDLPAQEALQQQQHQLDALRAELHTGQATARRLPEFRAQVADLEARLDSLRAVLPEQKDVADLLRRIQTLATQSNLDIRAFKPQPITTRQLHAEWPIALELDGSYHDLGLFFDKVSKVPRIINISGIHVRGRDAARARDGAADGGATITANCTATTFVLLENRPGQPIASGTKPGAAPARRTGTAS